MMAPMIFFSGFSSIIRYQHIIPNGYDKANLISMFGGAAADILFNILLIPRFAAAGAAAATVIAYVATLAIQIAYVRKDIDFVGVAKSFLPSLLFGAAMILCVFAVSKLPLGTLVSILAELAVGAAVFIACSVFWLEKTGDHIFSSMFHGLHAKLKK